MTWAREQAQRDVVARNRQARARFMAKRQAAAERRNLHAEYIYYGRGLEHYALPRQGFFSLTTDRHVHLPEHHRHVFVERFGWAPGDVP